jgi:aspartyl protease
MGTVVEHFQMGTFIGEDLRLAVIGASYAASSRNKAARHSAMVLGEDFLSNFTTEFDLAHGVIRLLRPKDCAADQLAYWSDTYSLAQLYPIGGEHAKIRADILLNGKRLTALFDTGAQRSLIERHDAAMAGVIAGQENAVAAGTITGIAGNPIQTWIGKFDTFSVGDESMRNVKLLIADIFEANTMLATGSRIPQPVEQDASMIIGCDFFLSHRILVSAKEHKMFFTYNGGPVFPFVEARATPTNASAHAE